MKIPSLLPVRVLWKLAQISRMLTSAVRYFRHTRSIVKYHFKGQKCSSSFEEYLVEMYLHMYTGSCDGCNDSVHLRESQVCMNLMATKLRTDLQSRIYWEKWDILNNISLLIYSKQMTSVIFSDLWGGENSIDYHNFYSIYVWIHWSYYELKQLFYRCYELCNWTMELQRNWCPYICNFCFKVVT